MATAAVSVRNTRGPNRSGTKPAAWAAQALERWYPDSRHRGPHFGEMLRVSEIHLYGNVGDQTYIGLPGEDGPPGTVNIPLPENAVGIAFEQDIDSKAVRAQPVQSESEAPRYARPVGKFAQYGNGLRKI